jgi:hypothetical protein
LEIQAAEIAVGGFNYKTCPGATDKIQRRVLSTAPEWIKLP